MKSPQVVENASDQKCRKCSVLCHGMSALTFSSNARPERLSKKLDTRLTAKLTP